MNENKEVKFGFFLSDASFDYGSKVCSLGVIDLLTKEQFHKVGLAKNPTDGEIQGLQFSIEQALKLGYQNVVFICDNKSAVNNLKKMFASHDTFKSLFWYVQFLWVPREFTSIADFLSKNIPENMSEELLDLKESGINIKKENSGNKLARKYVKDIKARSENINLPLEKRLNQLQMLLTEEYSFKSKTFSNIKSITIEELTNNILDEINLIENDIAYLDSKDPLIGMAGKMLIDAVIFS